MLWRCLSYLGIPLVDVCTKLQLKPSSIDGTVTANEVFHPLFFSDIQVAILDLLQQSTYEQVATVHTQRCIPLPCQSELYCDLTLVYVCEGNVSQAGGLKS